jgi:protein SCO1/2
MPTSTPSRSGLARPHGAVAAVLLASLALLLAGCGGSGSAATSTTSADSGPGGGIRLDPPLDVSTVSLPDTSQGGQPFAMRGPDGGLLVVYFGYTSCPDVCPTTLADLRSALKRLGPERAGRVEVAMVTIDPARDTGDVLTGYVQGFVPGAHALRTDDDAALRSAASQFGAQYDVTVGKDGQEEVGHTGFLYAVDSTGHVPMQWSFGTRPPALADDLAKLLRRAAG